jgi:hypothetical protein
LLLIKNTFIAKFWIFFANNMEKYLCVDFTHFSFTYLIHHSQKSLWFFIICMRANRAFFRSLSQIYRCCLHYSKSSSVCIRDNCSLSCNVRKHNFQNKFWLRFTCLETLFFMVIKTMAFSRAIILKVVNNFYYGLSALFYCKSTRMFLSFISLVFFINGVCIAIKELHLVARQHPQIYKNQIL